MKIWMRAGVGLSILLTGCVIIKVDPYIPLFNGTSLTGWTQVRGREGAWRAEDGLLVVEGGGGGWLRTEREYENFILELEFKLPPGGNSGVFLRAELQGDPAYTGLEIQVLDHFDERYAGIRDYQFCGSVYDLVPAKQEGLKRAGRWNAYEITHDRNHLVVVLNGVTIVDTDLGEQMHRLDTHPGLARTRGYIGLQNYDSRVEFRNVRIRELD